MSAKRRTDNSDISDRAKKQWEGYKERSKNWAIRFPHALLHSEAYKDLKYAPAIKVLNWFYEKIRLQKVNRKRRGMNRYKLINEAISFTYNEAKCRGLTDQQFSRALKELHSRGFIDIKEHGTGLIGDYTTYVISERWRDFDTPKFRFVEFPKSNYFGYRRMKKNKTNDENSLLVNDGISPLENPVSDEN